jgi:hypothetical protein
MIKSKHTTKNKQLNANSLKKTKIQKEIVLLIYQRLQVNSNSS